MILRSGGIYYIRKSPHKVGSTNVCVCVDANFKPLDLIIGDIECLFKLR